MSANRPVPPAAVVELIERLPADRVDDFGVVVNEVRINGVQLLTPADEPPVVHEITGGSDEFARVTFTVLARRVVLEQRAEPTEGGQ